jgi:hypothetical protein
MGKVGRGTVAFWHLIAVLRWNIPCHMLRKSGSCSHLMHLSLWHTHKSRFRPPSPNYYPFYSTMLAPSRRLLLYLRQACKAQSQASSALNGSQRATALFSTSACANSGHSKWATIKHDKARADAKKNKQRSMLAQQIELMSKRTLPPPPPNHIPSIPYARGII